MSEQFDDLPATLTPHSNVLSIRRAWLIVAAVSLGIAIQRRDGLFTPSAIALLATSVLAIVLSGREIHWSRWPDRWPAPDRLALAAALPIYFALMFSVLPAPMQVDPQSLRMFRALLAVAAVVAATLACRKLPLGRLTFPLLLLLFAAMAIWTIRHLPEPYVDVWVFQQDAGDVLAHGRNPYAMTFPNIYGDGAWVYAKDVQSHGRLLFGYPYMPLTLWFTTPFRMLLGDVRYAMLAAWIGSAIFIAYARPSRVSVVAATLWLFTPRAFFVIGWAWTEPVVVLMLAATVFAACRWRRALPYALGLFIASKQYLPATLLVAPLLIARSEWRTPKRWWPLLIRTLATVAVVSLPLILWQPSAFWRSAIELQFRQPFRQDSMSFLAWLSRADSFIGTYPSDQAPPFAAVIAFVALIGGGVLTLCKSKPSSAAFAGGVATMFLFFFAFSKQAFANYYTFVIGAMWCAIATMPTELHPADAPDAQ